MGAENLTTNALPLQPLIYAGKPYLTLDYYSNLKRAIIPESQGDQEAMPGENSVRHVCF